MKPLATYIPLFYVVLFIWISRLMVFLKLSRLFVPVLPERNRIRGLNKMAKDWRDGSMMRQGTTFNQSMRNENFPPAATHATTKKVDRSVCGNRGNIKWSPRRPSPTCTIIVIK